MLRPIDTTGPQRFIYAYVGEDGRSEVGDFLDELKRREKWAWSRYRVAFSTMASMGQATGDKWHMLDPKRPPHDILKDERGNKLSLSEMGEFKVTDHLSRIFHTTAPGGLMILLTVFTKKNQNEMTAASVNPALKAREELRRRKALLSMGRTK